MEANLLREQIITKLQQSGGLETIKSQLRSRLFLELSRDAPNQRSWNPKQQIALSIIHNYLEKHHLDYSISVLLPEAKCASHLLKDDEIITALGIESAKSEESLLEKLVNFALTNRNQKQIFDNERLSIMEKYTSEIDLVKEDHQKVVENLKHQISQLHDHYRQKIITQSQDLSEERKTKEQEENLVKALELEYEKLRAFKAVIEKQEANLNDSIKNFNSYKYEKEISIAENAKSAISLLQELKNIKSSMQRKWQEKLDHLRIKENQFKDKIQAKNPTNTDSLRWQKSSLKWQNECKSLVLKLDFQIARFKDLQCKFEDEMVKNKELQREIADMRLILHQTQVLLLNEKQEKKITEIVLKQIPITPAEKVKRKPFKAIQIPNNDATLNQIMKAPTPKDYQKDTLAPRDYQKHTLAPKVYQKDTSTSKPYQKDTSTSNPYQKDISAPEDYSNDFQNLNILQTNNMQINETVNLSSPINRGLYAFANFEPSNRFIVTTQIQDPVKVPANPVNMPISTNQFSDTINNMKRNGESLDQAIMAVKEQERKEWIERNEINNDPSLSSLLLMAKENIEKNDDALEKVVFQKEHFYDSDFSESDNLQTSIPSSRTLLSPEPFVKAATETLSPIPEKDPIQESEKEKEKVDDDDDKVKVSLEESLDESQVHPDTSKVSPDEEKLSTKEEADILSMIDVSSIKVEEKIYENDFEEDSESVSKSVKDDPLSASKSAPQSSISEEIKEEIAQGQEEDNVLDILETLEIDPDLKKYVSQVKDAKTINEITPILESRDETEAMSVPSSSSIPEDAW